MSNILEVGKEIRHWKMINYHYYYLQNRIEQDIEEFLQSSTFLLIYSLTFLANFTNFVCYVCVILVVFILNKQRKIIIEVVSHMFFQRCNVRNFKTT